jgi:hypothetical protein
MALLNSSLPWKEQEEASPISLTSAVFSSDFSICPILWSGRRFVVNTTNGNGLKKDRAIRTIITDQGTESGK